MTAAGFFAVQTPQGFGKELLDEAYEKACKDGFSGTDDASLVERLGYNVEIVDGDYDNIKITTKEDHANGKQDRNGIRCAQTGGRQEADTGRRGDTI